MPQTKKDTISRQRKLQIEHKKRGLCQRCSKPLWKGINKTFCKKHALWARENQRRRKGTKVRDLSRKSYLNY